MKNISRLLKQQIIKEQVNKSKVYKNRKSIPHLKLDLRLELIMFLGYKTKPLKIPQALNRNHRFVSVIGVSVDSVKFKDIFSLIVGINSLKKFTKPGNNGLTVIN